MSTPRKTKTDTDAQKRRLLKLASHAAAKHTAVEDELHAVLRHANEAGASLRELQDATGIPHVTIKRMIDRTAGLTT